MRGKPSRGTPRVKREPSKFFSMKVNPEGMSIGNFVDNTKRTVADTKKLLEILGKPKRTRGRGR